MKEMNHTYSFLIATINKNEFTIYFGNYKIAELDFGMTIV